MLRRYRDPRRAVATFNSYEDANAKTAVAIAIEMYDEVLGRFIRAEISLDELQVRDLKETLRRMTIDYREGDNLIMNPSFRVVKETKKKKEASEKEEKKEEKEKENTEPPKAENAGYE